MARVEPILEQGAKFDEPNLTVRDGYLFNWKTGERLTPIDSSSSLFPLPSSLSRLPVSPLRTRTKDGRRMTNADEEPRPIDYSAVTAFAVSFAIAPWPTS
ncbi:uncharacterized protein SOCE836_055450 [Sorangium cellulosum]|uniref:Uncharacterized protein n=1 Tax=Sorangium cellulosum TaxID=56 RepID=A0A4P2QTG8_SORCE|nr:uncharacterized protein SOCE836_055450 [Sorangium cellulosum]WCQ92702.1 hypothetical protein NQZ70_05445 [Sorangium sp. Soce836]